MFIQTAFSFSGVIQCLFCLFRASPAWAAQVFSLLASSPCVASASSYRFAVLCRLGGAAFSRLAPVAKFKLSVLASGSNISVKPTRILRSAYLAVRHHGEAVTIEISNQLSEVLSVIERHLESTLLAVHLYGSAVDGGLKPYSDIDLLVTVAVKR